MQTLRQPVAPKKKNSNKREKLNKTAHTHKIKHKVKKLPENCFFVCSFLSLKRIVTG